MKRIMISLFFIISFLAVIPYGRTSVEDGEAYQVADKVAAYVKEQIKLYQPEDDDQDNSVVKSLPTHDDENDYSDYVAVDPEQKVIPYFSAFGILIAPQFAFTFPTIVTLRVSPQIDIYFGRFMPPNYIPYIPTIRKR